MKKVLSFFLSIFITVPVFLLAGVATSEASTNLTIFDDSLASGWSNWSWGSSEDFNLNNPVYSGTKSLGFYPSSWGALYLHNDAGIDTTPYRTLTFALSTNYSNQKFQIGIYDSNNNLINSFKSLDNYGGDPPVGSWKTFTIPLSDLGAANRTIKGIALQNAANYSELVYIDSLALIGSSTQSSQTSTSSSSAVIPQNSAALSAAQNSYSLWKNAYVQTVSPGVLRVVRPENNNDTVSEGMGYGLLLSLFANDQTTFSGLLSYLNQYLDSKGLMNWQISSSGEVLGQGSATDADEDIAYALLRAEAKWPGNGYGQIAKNFINSMLNTEVLPSNLINPGDNWGATTIINPSYLSPAYYLTFATFTNNPRWNSVANTTLSWEQKASNSNTGLVPDWLNSDLSQPSISWDKYPNGFYYDALRAPIRLLMDAKWNNAQTASSILNKENSFLSSIGASKLVSGYTLTGSPLTNYLDMAFQSAYAAAAQSNSSSQFANDNLNHLIQSSNGGYFGTSLKTLTLFIISGSY